MIGLQEVCRGSPGWTTQTCGKWNLLSHRDEESRRGVGIVYDPKHWSVLRKKYTAHGIWCRMRHFDTQQEMWVGSVYVPPHVPAVDLVAYVTELLRALPPTTLPCFLTGDTNAGIRWTANEADVVAVGADGKGRALLDVLIEQGFSRVPHQQDQLRQPTSRPRREDAVGRIIDWVAAKRGHPGRVQVLTDSHRQLGTDHDALFMPFLVGTNRHAPRRITLGRRVVVNSPTDVKNISYAKLCDMAKTLTKPPPSDNYRDDEVVKGLFRAAKRSRLGHDWVRALRARRAAHQQWREQRVRDATNGDWGAFKSCTGTKHQGWEVHLAEALQPEDPHEALHNHYSTLFHGPGCENVPPAPEPARSPDFTVEEVGHALSKGKPGKSVSHDGISLELLRAIFELAEGKTELTRWFSHLLHTGDLPPEWNQSVMVLLPKLAKPVDVRHTRPISISNAVERVFSRLVLHRCRDHLSPKHPWQACGPRRQSLDYLHSLHRLFESEREWQKGLAVLKLDLSRAFDSVNRERLVLRLREVLGATEEARAWERLLTHTSTLLCTPWNTSQFTTGVGIRQGAVESPMIFAALTEWVLAETIAEFQWKPSIATYLDMELTQGAYMDDVVLWEGNTKELQVKVVQLQGKFREWGLHINIAKCSLYTSPKHQGPSRVTIDGIELKAQESVSVMSVEFRVGAGVLELLQPIWQRAKAKFWSISHLLRAKTPIAGRIRLLDRVVGGSALWLVAAFAPEQNALEAINHLLYQFVIWMLRPRKHATEEWVNFRQRTVRQARALVHRFLTDRWSSSWLSRWWGYMGHTARGLQETVVPGASIMNNFRNLEWWSEQQKLSYGARHSGRFRAKLGPLDGAMNRVVRMPWRQAAADREYWGSRCRQWIVQQDVPWSSGHQFSIEW